MIYGYCRVSTSAQARGHSLDEQEAALREAGAVTIIRESYTGASTERPAFRDLIARLEPEDKIIVTALDRFARSLSEGAQLVRELLDRGITIQVLNMGVIDNTPVGHLIANIFFAFAEFERAEIIERTQAGREAARARGKRVDGRPPKYKPEQIQLAMDLLNSGNSYSQVSRMTGISKSTLVRAKQRRIISP